MRGRILLTGGAGYIGSHAYVALAAAGYEVTILDNFSNAREDVPDRLELITGAPVRVIRADMLDLPALRDAFARDSFDGVVHFAALKAVGDSMERPLEYIRTNVGGLVNLLTAMEEAGVRRLVFSSSATVYGDPVRSPIPEDARRVVANTYGYTKLQGEMILEQIAAADPSWAFGTLRYFNPAGAHASALIGEDPFGKPNNLMPYIAKVAAGELEVLEVFGTDYPTPDGTGIRDYIHVEDLAEGHVLSLDHLMRTGQTHTVNLGTGTGYSVREVVAAFEAATGIAIPTRDAPRRPGDVPAYFGDPTLAGTLLGFRAVRDLQDMCRSAWAWQSRVRNGR